MPDIAGKWTGQTVDIESTHVSGPGPFRPTTGLLTPIDLTISQDGLGLSGGATIDLTSGTIQGTISPDGSVKLSGTFENADGFHAEITEWSTTVNAAGLEMAGQFTITQRFSNVFGPQVILQKCQILSLTRTP